MTGPIHDARPATPGSPRLTALALLIAGGAAVGLAVHPGSALAANGAWTPSAATQSSPALSLRAIADTDDDPSDGDDSAYGQFDDNAPDNDGLPSDGTDDDTSGDVAGTDDDGWQTNDGSADPGDDDTAGSSTGGKGGKKGSTTTKKSGAVVIDRRGRALKGPKTLALNRTARAGALHWTGWTTPTATAKGRITVRHGKTHPTRGTGTVTLTRLTTCTGGKAVYRKATLTIASKTLATVTLPGCSKLR